jgi:hypothetical protein
MIKILGIKGTRNHDNPWPTPEGHWVELVFRNEHGVHTIELNGDRPLPEDPELKKDLEWMLWDYGLLCQQDSKTARQRVRIAQDRILKDRLNYLLAKAFLEQVGGPAL